MIPTMQTETTTTISLWNSEKEDWEPTEQTHKVEVIFEPGQSAQ